jgi:DNA-binding MarR family transcriptional regulator
MTTETSGLQTVDRPASGPGEERSPSPDVGASLGAVLRAVARVRDRFRAQTQRHGLDWSAFGLLRPVVENGPQRVTSLATTLHLAPSTVSRLANHLVDAGLLERHADAADGRVIIVAPTDRGREAYTTLRRLRDEYVTALLDDWPAADRFALALLLDRLADAIEQGPVPGETSRPYDTTLTATGIR